MSKSAFRIGLGVLVALRHICCLSRLPPPSLILDGGRSMVISKDTFRVTQVSDIFAAEYGGNKVICKRLRIRNQAGRRNTIAEGTRSIHEGLLWFYCQGPGVLPFLGYYIREETPHNTALYLISSYQESGNIVEYLKTHEGNALWIELIKDVVEGLVSLHKKGIIHGDIRGCNIFVNADGHALIGEFGCARLSADGPISTSRHTGLLGGLIGAIPYQPPEHLYALRNDKFIFPSASADIYSLACLIYEMYTGLSPYYEISPRRQESIRACHIMEAVVNGPSRLPLKPQGVGPAGPGTVGLTSEIWALMEECWDRNLQNRPSASVLAEHPMFANIF
ncbi:kinase-like domain-containing protein [Ephemerocybe angulata]|uniref:Kinase-like domain-containing protein n=1 Tax=Ephemerocybe angulata TaxID=980116 RepID=A0A8H6HKC7_9AGAR|nr:kinase-like domain-containing protein [Tulosesus angulatus]